MFTYISKEVKAAEVAAQTYERNDELFKLVIQDLLVMIHYYANNWQLSSSDSQLLQSQLVQLQRIYEERHKVTL